MVSNELTANGVHTLPCIALLTYTATSKDLVDHGTVWYLNVSVRDVVSLLFHNSRLLVY